MVPRHHYEVGDEVRVRIPEGYWNPTIPWAKPPFAEVDEGDLLVWGKITSFSVECAIIENIRGEWIRVDLEWIIVLSNLEELEELEELDEQAEKT